MVLFERLASPLTTDDQGVYVRLVGMDAPRYFYTAQVSIEEPVGTTQVRSLDQVVGWQHAVPFNQQHARLEFAGATRLSEPVSLTLTTNPRMSKTS